MTDIGRQEGVSRLRQDSLQQVLLSTAQQDTWGKKKFQPLGLPKGTEGVSVLRQGGDGAGQG